jgi:hypothetical protein
MQQPKQNMSVRFVFPTDATAGNLSNMSFTPFTGIPVPGDLVYPDPQGAPLRVSHRAWTVTAEGMTMIEINLATVATVN